MSEAIGKNSQIRRKIDGATAISYIEEGNLQLSSQNHSEDFVHLITAHQGRLYVYVLSLLGNHDAANEVLQETNIVLWKQRQEFQPGTSFRAWAFRIAHFQTMAFRQRCVRDRLEFDAELISRLAVEAKQNDDLWIERSARLVSCLEQLSDRHRNVVRLKYAEGLSGAQLATRLRRSANAVSQLLFRLRERLAECVQRADAVPGAWGVASVITKTEPSRLNHEG